MIYPDICRCRWLWFFYYVCGENKYFGKTSTQVFYWLDILIACNYIIACLYGNSFPGVTVLYVGFMAMFLFVLCLTANGEPMYRMTDWTWEKLICKPETIDQVTLANIFMLTTSKRQFT